MLARTFLAVTLALSVGLPLAAQEEPMMSVEPNPATTDDPLLVTVDSDGFFCDLLEPVYLDDQVIVIGATSFCDEPPPGPDLYHLLPPLGAGIWEIQLNASDLPVNYPLGVLETLEVTVTDPHFDIRFEPPVATEDDEVVAHVTVVGVCPDFDPIEVIGGVIRIEGEEAPLCVPNDFGPIEVALPVGRLPVGDYLAELTYWNARVAERELSVLPAGSCVADATTLCLDGGRFRVTATWTDPQGASGPARAVAETDETGLFWFFTPNNIETVVKVLDACDTPFESFWVFAAGLTDVGVELVVTDTETDTSVSYQNPLGRRFETITDTAAFDTCP